jgi:hypothetical protein
MFLHVASPSLPSEVSLFPLPNQVTAPLAPLAPEPATLFEGVLELFDKLLKARSCDLVSKV